MEVERNKKEQYIVSLEEQNQQLRKKNNTQPQTSKVNPEKNNQISEAEWAKLKAEFLQLKDAKQKEEIRLYEENDNLRKEIRKV